MTPHLKVNLFTHSAKVTNKLLTWKWEKNILLCLKKRLKAKNCDTSDQCQQYYTELSNLGKLMILMECPVEEINPIPGSFWRKDTTTFPGYMNCQKLSLSQ